MIVFAERVLALLDTGRFTATYKYAVLLALIDLCVEQCGPDGRPPQVLHSGDVAAKVLELYWPQAVPYGGAGGATLLRQITGRGDLASKIGAFRQAAGVDRHATVEDGRRANPAAFDTLQAYVHATVLREPLPRLQTVGGRRQTFLYELTGERLQLIGRVGEYFVRLAGVLRPVVQQQWAAFIARRNPDVTEEHYLDEFLFGAERVGLHRVRAPLRRAQDFRCFYCRERIDGRTHIDHFLPWSRSTDNGLDNLVAAHPGCNGAKSAALAAVEHLERWTQRSASDRLAELAAETGWIRSSSRTLNTARALYLWAPVGTLLWRAADQFEPINPHAVRGILGDQRRILVAAEEGRLYRLERRDQETANDDG